MLKLMMIELGRGDNEVGLAVTTFELQFSYYDELTLHKTDDHKYCTSVVLVGLYFCTNDINSCSYSR